MFVGVVTGGVDDELLLHPALAITMIAAIKAAPRENLDIRAFTSHLEAFSLS
jgi:hypothetical protein